MAKIIQDTDQRQFVMVYHDCLESDLFDNPYQIVVYIALKKFADNNNQCFPSLKKLASTTKMSKRKVQNTLKELQQKHLISIENRLKEDGSKSSNLYIIHDFKELWSAGNNEEALEAVKKHENDKLIAILEAQGYTVTKGETMPKNTMVEEKAVPEKEEIAKGETMPKNTVMEEKAATKRKVILEITSEDVKVTEEKLDNEPTKEHYQAQKNNSSDNNTRKPKSQEEQYTMENIKVLFDYQALIIDHSDHKEDIEVAFDILHEVLNSTKPVRINGERKPQAVVAGKLLKLTNHDIEYAIKKFHEQTGEIKNTRSYLLTILYHAKEQSYLDIMNLGHRNGDF